MYLSRMRTKRDVFNLPLIDFVKLFEIFVFVLGNAELVEIQLAVFEGL